MDSDRLSASPFDSLKSAKVLRSSASKQHSDDEVVGAPDLSLLWNSETSEKPTHPPRTSLTLPQELQAAKNVRNLGLKSSDSSDPLKSSATLSETLVTKPNTSGALQERGDVFSAIYAEDPDEISPEQFSHCKRVKSSEPVDKKSLGLTPEADLLPSLPEVSDLSPNKVPCRTPAKPILRRESPRRPERPLKMLHNLRKSCMRSLPFSAPLKKRADYPSDEDAYSHFLSQVLIRSEKGLPLSKLFDSLLDIFKECSVIPKEDLVQKIMTIHEGFVEKREVDLKLRQIILLAPEFIYERRADTGELSICVNKEEAPMAGPMLFRLSNPPFT